MTARTWMVRRRGAVVALAAVLFCACPEPIPADDAGAFDEEEQAVDAGMATMDDGGVVDCPTVTPFMDGDPCENEGQVCRSIGCIFPGPSCLELECEEGVWRNRAAPVDAGPDDGGVEAIRVVESRPLFAGLPVENAFLDPELTLGSSAGVLLFNAASTGIVTAERVVSAELPIGTQALRVRKSANPSGVVALLAARSRAEASRVQLDVGRPIGAPAPSPASIAFVGLFGDGSEAALDLAPSGDVVERAGIAWQRYAVAFAEGPIGIGHLVVTDLADADLFLAAPVLVPASDASFSMSLAFAAAPKRTLDDREARALGRARQADRDRLVAPRSLGVGRGVSPGDRTSARWPRMTPLRW